MPAPSLSQMVESMVKTSHPRPEDGWTVGWDVVVSYSEKEINAILQKSWEKHRDEMITKIEAQVFLDRFASDSDSDEDQNKPFQTYRLDLQAPRIQFVSDAQIPAVNLVLPVTAGAWERSDKPDKQHQLHKDAYQICITGIPIGTVTGTYEEVKDKQRDGKPLDVKQGDKECLFKNSVPGRAEDDFEVSWVVLNFPVQQKGLTVKAEIVPGYTTDPKILRKLNKHKKYIQTASQIWFDDTQENGREQFNLIRHALATIKNKTLPKQSGINIDLTPRKFALATYSGSFIEEPILSLFIHVVGGKDQGETKDLQKAWQGPWTSAKPEKIAPIPKDYTASVLIHPMLIVENILVPSLMKTGQGDWKLEPLSGYEGGGIAVNATWKKEFDLSWFWIPFGTPSEDVLWKRQQQLEVAAPKPKDLQGIPAKIQLYQREMDKDPVARIEWKFVIETYMEELFVRTWKPTGGDDIEHRKKTNNETTFSLAHDFPLKIKTTDYDATFDINTSGMESHWTVEDEPMSKEGGIWESLKEFFTDIGIPPPAEIYEKRKKKLAGLTPQFHFNKMGLGFFLTTNLLNPGSKVIEIDEKVGMRFPGNMLLVGRVVQGVDSITGKA